MADLTAADEATQLASLQAAIRRLNIHNLNTGYMKRKEVFNIANGVANRQGGWIKWPLGPLFAFLDHNKVTINLPISRYNMPILGHFSFWILYKVQTLSITL